MYSLRTGCATTHPTVAVFFSGKLSLSTLNTKLRANSYTGLCVADNIPQHHGHQFCASHYHSIFCLARKMEKEDQNAHPKTEGHPLPPKEGRPTPPREGSNRHSNRKNPRAIATPSKKDNPHTEKESQPRRRERRSTLEMQEGKTDLYTKREDHHQKKKHKTFRNICLVFLSCHA